MQLPHDSDAVRDRQNAGDTTTGAAPATMEPEGAATLTAAMVRRGRNPWWGNDRMAEPAAEAAVGDDDPYDGGKDDAEMPAPGAARKPFHRIDIGNDDNGGDDGGSGRNGGGAKRFGFDWRDSGLWRDVALFLTVFFAASSAMLYLSLRAL